MKIILNAGIYDLCHKGHLNLLRRMRAMGSWLVVVIHDDWSSFQIKDKIPIQDLDHRIKNLWITGLVDEIISTHSVDPAWAFEEVIQKYRESNEIVYMRGDDMTEDFPGQWMLDKYEIPIEFLPYTKGISSTHIKDMLIK